MSVPHARLALIVAGVIGLPAAGFEFLAAVAILLAASLRWNVRNPTLLLLVGSGIVVRVVLESTTGSDVLEVTAAAIRRMLAGLNPYGVAYEQSRPPGAPFPYGPMALLWYLPRWWDPAIIELFVAIAIGLILASQGRLVGLAVYVASPILVATAVDGSNDTSLGFLLLLAFMVARRWPTVGGGLLAAAVAFKISALAFVPLYLLWGGARVGLSFLAVSVVAWAPVVMSWGIATFIRSAEMANELHSVPLFSLGGVLDGIAGIRIPQLDTLRLVLGGIVVVATLRFRRTLDGVILGGSAVYLVTLFGGNWATFAYLAGLAPVICWRLDDWLGFASRSVRLPVQTPAVADTGPG